MHSVYQGRHAVRNLAWRYTRAREFFMRTLFNAGGTRVPLEKAITHTAYSKNHFLFFPSILFANTSAPRIFIQRFITFVRSNARRRFVPTFSFVIVKTTCVCKREREREILDCSIFLHNDRDFIRPAQTDCTAVDRRAFHYIRRYYLKRKTALFQILSCVVFPRRRLVIFLRPHYVKLITLSYATNA